jgi:hypothetical protein
LQSINANDKSYLKPRVNFVVLSEQIGKYENFVQYIEQAIMELPNQGYLCFLKGKLLLCLNRKEETKSTLKNAKNWIAKMPNNYSKRCKIAVE